MLKNADEIVLDNDCRDRYKDRNPEVILHDNGNLIQITDPAIGEAIRDLKYIAEYCTKHHVNVVD